ncbi:MAG: aldo/keto reductase [Chloroflexi bacterium RBG_13_46_14]|nr:MAG: aldo/keto reductase [Chloroflexi bacterium RBG_13_46_14]
MEYRRLGRSGLKVSEIGLGTNAFGARADEEASIKTIDRALELGVNFIDTAEVYVRGRSEEIIGKALKGKRSQAIIATKFGVQFGQKERGGSRSNIIKSLENSLRRLSTDYIDLYYLHYPDTETPIEETLRTLDDLIQAGKIRYIACSNFAGWQLCEAEWTSRIHNLNSFIAIQSGYNMLNRSIEREIVPCCEAYGISVIPWGPLASGFLTGKYSRTQELPARFAPSAFYNNVFIESNFDKLAKLEEFAKERGHKVGEIAVAWLLSHSWLGSVITGATNPEQVSSNVAAGSWKLTAEEVKAVDKMI